VSGQIGIIRQVQVTLVGLQHPSPQDLGVLLVGPNNEQVVLASGAGGNTAIQDVQLIFSDSAPGALPSVGPIASGSYRASNLNGRLAADFPGTGSTRPLSPSLSVFNGLVPNGTWSLYVRDFTGNSKGDGQQIAGGWMISFVTEANLTAIPNQETLEDTIKRVGIVIGDNQPGIAVTLTATSDRPDIVTNATANLRFEPGNVASANQVLVITPGNNKSGDVNITVTATVGSGVPSSRTFLLKVLPVNDDPAIAGAGSNDRTKAAGLIDGPRRVTVSDQESNANDIELTASSSNKDLIPDSNIILTDLNDGNGNWDITIVPNGVLTGETTITLSAKVGSEKAGTKSFKYTVTRNRSFVSEEGRIEIRDNATSNPYPSITRVSNVQGVVSKISVTLLGFSHTFPDDADILLVSPDGTKSVVLLSDAGGGAPTNSVSNLTFTIDDDGSDLTSEEKLGYKTYKPGNFGAGVFASPAPNAGYTSTLSTFNGISPNGDWKLYIQDDTFSDSGSIERGWILVIETAPSITPLASQTTREDTVLTVNFTVEDADTDAINLKTWALSSNETLVNNTNLVTGPTNAFSRTLTLTPSLNQNGTNTITVFVADNRVTNSSSFFLTVMAVDDAPTISVTTNLVRINEDSQTNILFGIRDVDSVLSLTNATILSSNLDLLPNSTNNITLDGPVGLAVNTAGTITASVKPAANKFGETLLTLSLRDGTTTVTRDVTLAVTAVNDAPTISVTNNAYTVNAGATLADIPVTVGDVETPARNLVLSVTSDNPGLLPTNNIALGGANENRLLSVTPLAGTGTAVITLRVRDEANAEATTNVTITVNAAPGRTFANTGAITVRDNNTATPYGSSISVGALEGFVSQVVVTLDGLTHSSPDDVDVLLVGPGGRKVLLLSDAGGNIPDQQWSNCDRRQRQQHHS
jgi:subtilisin-like proprotein convertase family protein